MITIRSQGALYLLKIYVVVALVVATILSPLAQSLAPVLLLIAYLYLWRWPISPVFNLLAEYFLFFAVAILFIEPVGSPYAWLIALPLLLLVNNALEKAAGLLPHRETAQARRPTVLCVTLVVIAAAVLAVAWLLGSWSLLLAGAAIIIYLGVLGIVVYRGLPVKPLVETPLPQRMVAGTEAHLAITLTVQTKVGGLLFIESPYDWLQVGSPRVSLKQHRLALKVSLSPPLAGPSVVRLTGYATDRWGLLQVRFEMEPIRLNVIPRARYAAWLAERYLSGTKPGALPLVPNIEALKPLYGLRRGIEYYGSQLYQPGDSLKNIDWKHSLRYNELITKEFTEFHGRAAVILINLAVGDAEEADSLAYKIVVTALSLAREGIPAALAVYNHEAVMLTTETLPPQQLLQRSLRVAQGMVTFIDPVKYLNPPDVARLRANLSRLRFARSKASEVLAQLLQIEYQNLSDKAKLSPVTRALSEVLNKVDKQSNLVVISQNNHDAEALAFNTFSFARRGNAIITV